MVSFSVFFAGGAGSGLRGFLREVGGAGFGGRG